MFVQFTQDDINRSKIVSPAFYRVRINSIASKAAKTGGGTNLWLEGVILKNADNGSEEFAGVPTPYLWMFSSKDIGKMIPLLQAVEPTFTVDPTARIPLDTLQGQELEVFIGNGTWNNQVTNVITNQYRPVAEKRTV